MRLLTFLGAGTTYRETAYVWQGQECVTSYAPVASCHFLRPDALTVFLTEEAQQQVYPAFRAALPKGMADCPTPIAQGGTESELWQIFEQVSGSVQPGEEAAFDITHGLRSFPLLGLLAAAFLRSGLRVRLRAVLYGAYEVRDQSVTPHRTPMFDLTPMLSLLEWAVAADRFNETGDARYLASLLKAQQRELARAAQRDAARLNEAGGLGGLADALTGISQALRLIRPYGAMARISELPERVARARPALERAAGARPFSLLMQTVEHAYAPLAMAEAEGAAAVTASLRTQRAMINWYAEREQWAQAATLAREWLVSWTMARLGQTDLTNHRARGRVEDVIGAETDAFLAAKREERRPFAPIFLASLPGTTGVLELWSDLREARNDIDHAGMRENPTDPERLIRQIRRCVERLNALPLDEDPR